MWLNIALGIMIVGALINIVLTVIPMLLKPVFDSYTQIKTAQSIDTTGVALF